MSLPSSIRVMIVDDHPLLREGLLAILAKAPDIELVAEADSGEEAVARFVEVRPDVTLMDLRMPGLGGLNAISAIRRNRPNARLIALSTYAGGALVQAAHKAGASGYLLKSMLAENVLDSIRTVHRGREVWPSELLGGQIYFERDRLSFRELDVLRNVAGGLSNRAIGDKLGISEETVKSYMRTVMTKLGANDRTHAVTICLQRGLLDTWEL
ncbi:DNA-binding NarL/FixJ family response regulator [Duganella sp. 1224]|uniref:response regulator transcription factor n=1 Tax=Duganella sp. 1224 TaxID=2587052 RepID=UPI0015CCA5FE|nr:response regulator transcription factor [Duganella sp. 1224]NYE59487.1 DNA-binding NarL/FixJ family response regulator [Duganella sp. 1224]